MEQISLFSDWKGKSQADRVLWHLETFGRITNLQCHELYWIRHCPSVIRNLRKKFIKENRDYEIINEPKKGIDRFGNATWWDEYVLVKKNSTKRSISCREAENVSYAEFQNNNGGRLCN